ncbi:hypothetical protein D3H35_01835 [Cohnella faecalis]|uniref:Uncharacterized protein n=1 Tax=Cohnella faecalis TaxID=2315694 RepID=A0A398D2I5_9BACL|nr:hypothetical protein D3H35_01835 [Cohnella faecalis]
MSRRKRRLEPLPEKVFLEEVERPFLLLLLVLLSGEIDHFDFNSPVLHQLFERGVDAGADEIDLRLDAPLICVYTRSKSAVISTFRADASR